MCISLITRCFTKRLQSRPLNWLQFQSICNTVRQNNESVKFVKTQIIRQFSHRGFKYYLNDIFLNSKDLILICFLLFTIVTFLFKEFVKNNISTNLKTFSIHFISENCLESAFWKRNFIYNLLSNGSLNKLKIKFLFQKARSRQFSEMKCMEKSLKICWNIIFDKFLE